MQEIFKKQFVLPSDGFLEPIDLTDIKIGFSVFKDRPQKGFKSLFRIYINNDALSSVESLKPLTVTASYGKETENGITTYSSEFKRNINWPIDLVSNNEFFYDIEKCKLFYKDKEISGLEVLKKVDEWHTKPNKLIGGSWLRTKLIWFRIIIPSTYKFLFKILSGFLYLSSGEKVDLFFNFFEQKNQLGAIEIGSPKISRGDLIDIFGFKIEQWIAILYSIFHLSIFFIFYRYNYNPLWLTIIFKNNFLILMYVIISVGIAKIILPELLRPSQILLNLLAKIQIQYFKYLSRKIKI